MPEKNQTHIPMMARGLWGGKKTAKIDARVNDDLKEAIRRRWNDLGLSSESEYIEMLAAVDCWGLDHVRSMRDHALLQVGRLTDMVPTSMEAAQ
jgi:hypothetical protein